jgi:predicted AlkP superfamily phosphohydrolase/phosphomutase
MRTRHWYDAPTLKQDLLPLALALMDSSKQPRYKLSSGWLDIILIKDNEKRKYIVMRDHKIYDPDKFFSHESMKYKYPDASRRISGYFSQRSADIVLLANYSDGFYFSPDKVKAGTHGNLSIEDSCVPFMVAGKNIIPSNIPAASIVDVAPTIASLFGVRMPTSDGIALNIVEMKNHFE